MEGATTRVIDREGNAIRENGHVAAASDTNALVGVVAGLVLMALAAGAVIGAPVVAHLFTDLVIWAWNLV